MVKTVDKGGSFAPAFFWHFRTVGLLAASKLTQFLLSESCLQHRK